MFKSQAEEIIRRCAAGILPEQALQISNPIKLGSVETIKKSTIPVSKLTSGSLKTLKVNF